MTTASELVTQAYRDGNLIGIKDAPTSEQMTEGLDLLGDYFESLLGYELGEFNFDWPTPPSTTSPVPARFPLLPLGRELPSDVWPYPPSNVRVLLSIVANTTIFLPQDPDDGARILLVNLDSASTFSLTIEGNGRLIQGAAKITELATALDQRHLFYRADLGGWQVIAEFISTTDSPLPRLYDRLLSMGTLEYLMPRYGKDITSVQQKTMRRLVKRLKSQYRQSVGQPSADPQPFFLPSSDRERGQLSDTSGSLF